MSLILLSSISYADDKTPTLERIQETLDELALEEGELPKVQRSSSCVTAPGGFWVCKGDVAFATGYLIDPSVFDMRLVPIWERRIELMRATLGVANKFKQERNKFKKAFAIRNEEALDLYVRNWRMSLEHGFLVRDLNVWRTHARKVQSAYAPGWRHAAVLLAVLLVGVGSGVWLSQ